MRHADHVGLLRDGVTAGVWADLGSGDGAFTLVLADLLGPTGRIYSIDRDEHALRDQQRAIASRFPAGVVEYVEADFTGPLELSRLDGIVMANSLHFERDQEGLLRRLVSHLAPAGRFLLVEYDTDRGNTWVPYPLPFAAWSALASRVGLVDTRLLGRVPSRYLGSIYSALSVTR